MRYVADDGTEFNTEQDCLDYENEQINIRNNFILYDKDFNKIDINDIYSYEYLYIISNVQEVAEYLKHWVGFCYGLNDIGLYRLNDDGNWEFVNDLIDRHKKELDILETAVRKIQPLEKSCETCKFFDNRTLWCSQYNDTTYHPNCSSYKSKEMIKCQLA